MAVAVTLLAVLLAAASGPVPLPSAQDEMKFGIEAAQKGLWAEARFRFERAVTLDPMNAKAYNDLAVAHEQQGDFKKAREAYDKALKLKPGDELIQQNYDLFREADDKRNRKAKTSTQATPGATPAAPAATPAVPQATAAPPTPVVAPTATPVATEPPLNLPKKPGQQ
jgi:Flp pilus assembly protein TadD